MNGMIKFLLIVMFITILVCGLITTWGKMSYDEVNDPNRDYYITRTDDNLNHGEIYEKEYIAAHTDRRIKTEMQAGMGYCVKGNGRTHCRYAEQARRGRRVYSCCKRYIAGIFRTN